MMSRLTDSIRISLARSNNVAPAMKFPMGQPARDHDAKQKPGRFRDHGGDRRAGNAEIEHQHQERGRGRIDQVDGDLGAERQSGACLSDQPAQHDVIAERHRRRPDPDREVGFGGLCDALAAAHDAEQDGGERNLQQDQRSPDHRRNDEAPNQDHAQFRGLAGAERLRRERDRAHAQEREQPEHAVEQHRGDRHAAEQRGVTEPPDRHGRDDADQRRGQVRDHRRTRDGKHLCRRDFRSSDRRMHAYSSTTRPSLAVL
jgi:hypothetical protein